LVGIRELRCSDHNPNAFEFMGYNQLYGLKTKQQDVILAEGTHIGRVLVRNVRQMHVISVQSTERTQNLPLLERLISVELHLPDHYLGIGAIIGRRHLMQYRHAERG